MLLPAGMRMEGANRWDREPKWPHPTSLAKTQILKMSLCSAEVHLLWIKPALWSPMRKDLLFPMTTLGFCSEGEKSLFSLYCMYILFEYASFQAPIILIILLWFTQISIYFFKYGSRNWKLFFFPFREEYLPCTYITSEHDVMSEWRLFALDLIFLKAQGYLKEMPLSWQREKRKWF